MDVKTIFSSWFSGVRPWLLAALAGTLLIVGVAAALPVLGGKTEPPLFSREAAERAVSAARQARAARWAPQALLEAEAAFRAARIEHRRQEVRFILFRNFAVAREGLRLAETKARVAAEQATHNREEATSAAEEAIATAEEALAEADAFATSLQLDPPGRTLLQRSKIAVREARILERDGEPLAAKDRAETASRQAEEVCAAAVRLAERYTDPVRVGTWRRWVDQTIAQSRRTGGEAIVVYKEKHLLTLYDGGRAVCSYRAEMGYNMVHAKLRSGDGVTPEGRYRITAKKSAGESNYYKALLLDYPNEDDRERFATARRAGHVPRWASPGGLIEIHGEGGRGKDWTKGCVALSNPDMDSLFARVSVGTPVTIVGSDGRGGVFTNMIRENRSSAAAAGAR